MGDMHAMRAALSAATPKEKPPLLTLIFALDLDRARVIAKERGLARGQWRYVTRLEDLRGYRGPQSCLVLIADSWYQRANDHGEMREILLRLRTADLTSEYVGDH